jgi:hypothetical protein
MSKYPHINIALVGEDGNAFSILGRCTREMKRNGLADKVDEFIAEATSGDYSKLLVTVMDWFSCDETDDEDEWYESYPNGCYPCKEKYAVGGCPACGE